MSEPTVSRLGLTGRFGACPGCGGHSYVISDRTPYGKPIQQMSVCCEAAKVVIERIIGDLMDCLPPAR